MNTNSIGVSYTGIYNYKRTKSKSGLITQSSVIPYLQKNSYISTPNINIDQTIILDIISAIDKKHNE